MGIVLALEGEAPARAVCLNGCGLPPGRNPESDNGRNVVNYPALKGGAC